MSTPEFPRADPADAPFWEMRYEAGFTPWDAGRVPAALRDFLDRQMPAGRVLVPGCGSAWDVRFLAERGCDVEGIDFSSAAIDAARPVMGPHANRVRRADFFGAEVQGPFALLYERAFLCALPRRMWTAWAGRVADLLAPGGRLAGFFYFDEGDRGPPFGLHGQHELDRLLEGKLQRIEDAAVADSIAVFDGKERWQAWQRG